MNSLATLILSLIISYAVARHANQQALSQRRAPLLPLWACLVAAVTMLSSDGNILGNAGGLSLALKTLLVVLLPVTILRDNRGRLSRQQATDNAIPIATLSLTLMLGTLSAALSDNPHRSGPQAVLFFVYGISFVYLIPSSLRRDLPVIANTGRQSVLMSSAMVCIACGIGWFFLPKNVGDYYTRWGPPYLNPNTLALFAGAGFLASACVKHRAARWGLMAAFLWVLFETESRTSLAASLIGYVAYVAGQKSAGPRTWLRLIGSIAASGIALWVWLSWFGSSRGGSIEDLARDRNVRLRLEAWSESWTAITENPWLGVGPGLRELETASSAHSMYVSTAMEYGLLGSICIAGLWGNLIYRCWTHSRRGSEPHRWTFCAIVFALARGVAESGGWASVGTPVFGLVLMIASCNPSPRSGSYNCQSRR